MSDEPEVRPAGDVAFSGYWDEFADYAQNCARAWHAHAAGWAAGRASRDAEVAELKGKLRMALKRAADADTEQQRHFEIADGALSKYAANSIALTSAVARADAAEAVIAAVYGDMHLMQMTSDPNDEGAYVLGPAAEKAMLDATRAVSHPEPTEERMNS